jgi:hypothetical protein
VVIIALASFAISYVFSKSRLVGSLLVLGLFVSNMVMITKYNPKGTVAEINAQEGMLLTDAIKVMDYTYQKSGGQPFSVSAATIPYNINTTWSYLYGWYGLKKYGYLPIWGSENALGFKNVLEIEPAQSELPPIKFTIVEPPRGLSAKQIEDFLQNEDLYWEVLDEVHYGQFTVQYRKAKIPGDKQSY